MRGAHYAGTSRNLGGWSSDIGIDDGQQMAVPFDVCIGPQGSLCCRAMRATQAHSATQATQGDTSMRGGGRLRSRGPLMTCAYFLVT